MYIYGLQKHICDSWQHGFMFAEQTVHVDAMSGAPTTLYVLKIDRGLAWEVIPAITCCQIIWNALASVLKDLGFTSE